MSLDTDNEEILNILEELQCPADQRIVEECTEQCRLTGKFVSDTVFNISNKILSDTEIRILEKGLDFASIQNKINEPELRRDFKELCPRMALRWPFRNEPTPELVTGQLSHLNHYGTHLQVIEFICCCKIDLKNSIDL